MRVGRSGSAAGSAAISTATRTSVRRRSRTLSSALAQLARDLYREELRALGAAWGMSTTVIGPVSERADSDEPFRAILVEIWERLGADGYADGAELVADLDDLDTLLRAHRGERVADGRLADLRARARTFGLHLAKLDVRVHASAIHAPDDRLRATLAAASRAQVRHGAGADRSADRLDDAHGR